MNALFRTDKEINYNSTELSLMYLVQMIVMFIEMIKVYYRSYYDH